MGAAVDAPFLACASRLCEARYLWLNIPPQTSHVTVAIRKPPRLLSIINAKRSSQKRILPSRYFNHPSPCGWHFPADALEFIGRGSAFGLSSCDHPTFTASRRRSTCLSNAQPCNRQHRPLPTIRASTRRSTPSLPPATPIPLPSSARIPLTATGLCAFSCLGPRKPVS